MKYRSLGRTPFEVSEISFGAWAIGKSCWGNVNDEDSMRALHAAADAGVNFFDTADVYGAGLSEQLCARLKRERSEPIIIATKVGRGANPHTRANYTPERLSFFVDRSLGHLGTDSIDLLQLHCPPPECYYQPEIIDAVERLVQAGKVRYWGVSVERVEEALKSIEYPGCQSIQIIYNVFRQRPAELLFEQTRKKRVGIIARVPLASGLLTGKLSKQSRFADDDHRTFNREGAAFDAGETFAGVPYEVGLQAVDELKRLLPREVSLARFALRWILMNDAVSCAIPGAKTPEQARENVSAAELPALSPTELERITDIYDRLIKPYVHQRW